MKIFVFSIFLIFLIQKSYSSNFLLDEKNEEIIVKNVLSWNEIKYIDQSGNKTSCSDCIPDKIKYLDKGKFLCNFPKKSENSSLTFALFDEGNKTFTQWPHLTSDQGNLSLTSVTAFELDKNGAVYILDNGRINYNNNTDERKLLIFSKEGSFIKNISFSNINKTNADIKSDTYFTDMVYDNKHNYMILSDSSF